MVVIEDERFYVGGGDGVVGAVGVEESIGFVHGVGVEEVLFTLLPLNLHLSFPKIKTNLIHPSQHLLSQLYLTLIHEEFLIKTKSQILRSTLNYKLFPFLIPIHLLYFQFI